MSDQLGSYIPTAGEHSEMCEEITQLREAFESLTAERDALAARVAELERALKEQR